MVPKICALFVPQGPRICAPFPRPVHQTEVWGVCKFFAIFRNETTTILTPSTSEGGEWGRWGRSRFSF